MADARTEAIEAMLRTFARQQPCSCDEAYVARQLVDPGCIYHEVDGLEDLLDAIPTAALVRLVIERGGLLPAGKTLLSADATGSVVVPVYRIAEEPS